MKTALAIVCGVAFPFMALAKPASPSSVDQKFVEKASCGGLAEVELGKLALQKSQDENVKAFAQKMVDDHSAANQKLETVAQAEGLVPKTVLGSKEQKIYDKLAKLDGEKFDRAYMDVMRKDHDKDVKEFEKASGKVQSASLRDFINTTLPTLHEHDDMAHSSGMKK